MQKSDEHETRIIFGDNIRSCRTRLNWSQKKLAQGTGMNPAYIGRVERAQENISVDNILRIAYALDIDPSTYLSKNFRILNHSLAAGFSLIQ